MVERIIRALQGKATDAELEELRAWREVDPENERLFQEIVEAWNGSESWRAIDASGPIPRAQDLLQSVDAPREAVPVAGSDPGKPVPRNREDLPDRRARPGWAVPLGAAAILVIGLGLGYVATTDRTAPTATAAEEFRTGPEERLTAVMGDGTAVRIGPGSTLQATITDEARDIRLEGRAFFAVAKDPRRPLTVHTSRGDARVLGTRFEVQSAGDDFHLLVVEGRVALSRDGEEAELEAGEMARGGRGETVTIRRVEVPEELLGWMGSWMAFESTPLSRVARELEIRLGITVEIEGPDLSARTISGWIDEEDPDQVLEMICSVADVRCEKTDGVLRMKP